MENTEIATKDKDSLLSSIVSRDEVMALLGKITGTGTIHPMTLWRYVHDGKFPAPIQKSRKMQFWLKEDIQSWLKEKKDKVKVLD